MSLKQCSQNEGISQTTFLNFGRSAITHMSFISLYFFYLGQNDARNSKEMFHMHTLWEVIVGS